MSLRSSAIVVSLAAGLVSFAPQLLAQDQQAIEVPNSRNIVTGEINAAGVYARSGPADSYYPTMMLNKGDRVTVVGYRFEWLKILPPAGSFSYVAKIYIDRDGAANTGKVNRDNVLVHAGSATNPQMKAQTQMKLDRGATVDILGEADEYYKVKPPEGCYLYVNKGFVDVVGAGNAAAPTGASAKPAAAGNNTVTAKPAAVAGAAGTGAAVATGVEKPESDAFEIKPATPKKEKAAAKPKEAATDSAPTATEEPGNAEAEADFRKLESQFSQSKDQPLEDQPVADMLKGYTQLQGTTGLSSTTRRMVDYRVKYLTIVSQQQADLLKAQQQAADFSAKQSETVQEQKQIEQRIKENGVAIYLAVGQLQPSSVQKDGQALLRLVDPGDGRTLIYIRTADTKQRGLVGKFVGVRGEVAKDDQLSVDYVEPTEMEAVDPAKVFKGVTAKIYPASSLRGAGK